MTPGKEAFARWAEAQAILKVLDAVDEDGKVDALADALDALLDQRHPARSEEIQKRIRQRLLLPIIKRLGAENPEALKAEVKTFFGI